MPPTLVEQFQAALDAQKDDDPWRAPLSRLRGTISGDGIERISTQAAFDVLEISQHCRGSGASRRLAAVMAGLGWSAIRLRAPTRGGYLEQVRGYCREARHAPPSSSAN